MSVPLAAFVTGGVVGLSIAAPVGPIGALTVRRTLAQGRAIGLSTGLGAATADALYGAIAGFGLTFIAELMLAQQSWLRLGGGLFLLYLGVKTYRSPPARVVGTPVATGLFAAWGSTFLLTLANPTTILSFIGIFAALGLHAAGSGYAAAAMFVLGVFLGSALWWLLLTASVGLLRARLTGGAMRWVNRLSGALIAAFGVVALAGLVR